MTTHIAYEVLDWLKGKNGNLLDAGSGNSGWTDKINDLGFRVTRCDKIDHPNTDKVDLEGKLPYRNNTFNFITCIEVIEHIENTSGMISGGVQNSQRVAGEKHELHL
jgi:hypothetical protein